MSLSPAQQAFLNLLRAGQRSTGSFQDALAIGPLIRLKFVSWHEPKPGRSSLCRGMGTFSLTPSGISPLRARDHSAVWAH
jgi:hypothetical protein